MADHLNEAWKRVATQLNEADEAKQFNALLESIFKRKIVRVKKSVLESRYRKMKMLIEAGQDEDPDNRTQDDYNNQQAAADADAANRGSEGGDGRDPGNVDGAATTDNPSAETPAAAPAAPPAESPAPAAPADSAAPADKPAPATPIDIEKLKALQAKTPAVVKAIIDRGGNGIPEIDDVNKVMEPIKASAGTLDPVLIDAVTKNVNSESVSNPKYAIDSILDAVNEKGKFRSPNFIRGIYSEVAKLVPQMKSLKNSDDIMKTAYSLYLSFVITNGFGSAGIGVNGADGIKSAFTDASDSKTLFSALQQSTKNVGEEQAIETALEWVNNNAGELQDEAAAAKIQKNLPIYIKNVYKHRALGATLRKQSDVIFKMTKGG